MAKILKASFEKNCIGCELCVIEVQKQLGKIGLEESPIRIFKNMGKRKKPSYTVDVDPSVNELDVEKIEKICPALVFTLEESQDHELAN